MPEVFLTRNAEKDLRRIGAGPERRRILSGLAKLGENTANLDVKILVGSSPWRRLRIGDYRVIYWLTPDSTYEVDRIVHRRELNAAAANLPTIDETT